MKYNDTQYYYQGYSSHQTGLPYESSPHPIGSPARLEWCRGWRDAENDSRKRLTSTETDNANQQFESLAPKPDEVWNGEGLPPVGCECELFDYENWNPVIIKFVGEKYVVTERTDLGYEVVYCVAERPERFRPIRTEGEIRREDFAKSLCDHLDDLTEWDSPVGKVHALAIYDAIAAGKIPHIKLESPHE